MSDWFILEYARMRREDIHRDLQRAALAREAARARKRRQPVRRIVFGFLGQALISWGRWLQDRSGERWAGERWAGERWAGERWAGEALAGTPPTSCCSPPADDGSP